ncbi:hypothetical protein DUNSADRAFT_3794 [Dunaliella salina]|uniref:SET domain-containing protein n=1 Tax=Dunaliella salina TaxID=3046 RepID=A0ABQ7GTB5_DUNSA|nr:hypothetical protein DUNSADRAFT_3794 [Dunaliella salina]|eukprot:KAF5837831.1 hypothetical protein DUNSADRAFT_3794 [Dunaliella salina]
MEDFMKYAYHVRCRLGYSIFRGWRVLAIASVESGQPLLNMPEMDPYTDIVLSACCTDNRRPNAKVTDRGRTIIAIKSISKGEEVVTHSGAPDAALQSAGLVRLIASSSLARAMHMDIFASEDESEDEKVCTKQQRRKGMQNVYVGAAAHVQACEGMGAESDEDMEGKGRGRKSMRGRGGRSLGKRAGQRVLKGGGTWKPFVCQCSPQQGKVCADEHSCLNRAQHVECTPGVCGAGELCQNQRIQRMQSPYLMLRHVGEEKGWGVLAGEPVPAGAFIVQYTGEVVTKEEASKRLQQYEALRIPHYYLMTLSTELVVDATRSGSLGRFVNHSSQPNCVTEKWLVEGREVVIITAKRDVAAGEELCYDYNCANQIWFSCI